VRIAVDKCPLQNVSCLVFLFSDLSIFYVTVHALATPKKDLHFYMIVCCSMSHLKRKLMVRWLTFIHFRRIRVPNFVLMTVKNAEFRTSGPLMQILI
jgi:hypothetical protein